MDPASAIGLVASITGIVSFGSKTVKIASQIRHAGSDDGIRSLESSAQDMNKAAQLLRSQSSTQSGSSGSSVGSDQGMLLLADRSLKVVDSILKLSEDVRGAQKDGKSAGRWSAVQQALKIILSGDRIDSLEKELNGIRGGLQLQATVLIKEKLETNSMKLDEALKSLDKYAASLLSAGSVLDSLRWNTDTIIKNQSRGEILAEARHAEVMQYIAAPRHPDSDPQSRALQSGVKSGEEALRAERIAAQRILDWLWFPDMAEREKMIDSAFDQTFEWVFCDPKQHQKPWDNFGGFLRSNDSTTYWITGKPGSGKSTLMKFIANNSKTKRYLREWSGAEPTCIAKYYFSHRASELQRTEAGMLRSLHYQILHRKRDWVEQAHPGRFRIHRDQENGTTMAASAPNIHELRTGLDDLIKGQPSSRFFFIIDGLDEHKATEATVGLLANSLLRLATYPNVKILISSRPWLVFEEVFDKSPRLQVHELTRDDILHFTTANILNHPRTLILQRKDPSMITTLINEIADASSGVFLWVSLVVRSLLQGLRNHDTAEDLRTRLHELPTELHDFFYHMWTQVPQRYKAQASRLLQLVEAGTTDGRKISLLRLNFAQEADQYAREMKVEPLTDEEVGARTETTRKHLLTRSLGLVEVLDIPTNRRLSPTSFQSMAGDLYHTSFTKASQGYPNAAFIHKTVYEFLSVPDIRQELERVATSGLTDHTAPYSPMACLLRSALVKIKIFHAKSRRGLPLGLRSLVSLFLAFARETEQTTGLGQTWFLEELDRTMSSHQRASTKPGVSWYDFLEYEKDLGAYELIKDPPIKDLVGLAVNEDLFYTLKDMVAHNQLTWSGLSLRKRPLLLDALFPAHLDSLKVKKPQPRFEMVDLVLQACPEPKDSVKVIMRGARAGWEADEMCLWNLYADKVFTNPGSPRHEPQAVETFLRIFKLFLKYHPDHKSTTADLASMRSRFVAFLKSPETQADARLSRFNQEVGDAIELIDELELSWARQRQAVSESMVKWQEERDILAANPEEETNSEEEINPEEYTNPGTNLVQENNAEGNCIDSGAKHRTPNGSSRTDRFRRWFHQRRLGVSARPKSDSKPRI
ncbi:hypothetical protein V8F33_006310 [Rhypophila sp. PSN 637]